MKAKGGNTFANAIRGILETFRSERNFKIHLVFGLLALLLGIWLGLAASEWCWIALCIALVLILELLNTAIETLVDLVSPTYHPLAKKVKDAGAGAVLLAAAFAVIVGSTIFAPKIWAFFFT